MKSIVINLLYVLNALLVGFVIPLESIEFINNPSIVVYTDLLQFLLFGAIIYTQKQGFKLKPSIYLELLISLPAFSLLSAMNFAPSVLILLPKLIFLRHIGKIRELVDHYSLLSPVIYRMIPLFAILPTFLHIVSCGWILIGSGSSGTQGTSIEIYVKALYWTFATLTTVGYGDITAVTLPQMLYSCGVGIAGVGFYGYVVSNVASLLARTDAARENHIRDWDEIELFMDSNQISEQTRNKVSDYFHYTWKHKIRNRDVDIFNHIPKGIRSDLFYEIYASTMKKVPFLKEANRQLMIDLMDNLKPIILSPEEVLFSEGEIGDRLYLIHKGSIKILNSNNQPITTLSEGAFLGELALINSEPRNASAIASGYCVLFFIEKDLFLKTLSKYPSFKQHFEKIAEDRQSA